MLNRTDRERILDTAYAAVHACIHGTNVPVDDEFDIPETTGLFVTLHVQDALRGCIGFLQMQGSFMATLCEAARKAATCDYRFSPVGADDLDTLSIDVTLLGTPEILTDPMDFVLGKHGLILEKGRHRGLLLPQVPVEHHWDKQQFLEGLCKKALVATSTWRAPDAGISRFEGTVLTRDYDRSRFATDGDTT